MPFQVTPTSKLGAASVTFKRFLTTVSMYMLYQATPISKLGAARVRGKRFLTSVNASMNAQLTIP